MLNELNALESKIIQVVSLCRALRMENTQLRQQLAASEEAKRALADRMESARNRLEELAQHLPETQAKV